jgi:hypothetical protein
MSPRFEGYGRPPWSHPPDDELPVAVLLNHLVARSPWAAVMLGDARVFSTGVMLGWAAVRREPREARAQEHPSPFFMFAPGPRDLRIGVELSDGTRAEAGIDPAPEDEVVLLQYGGGGNELRYDGRLWLWPLPPAGALTLTVTWLDLGIDPTTIAIDGSVLRAAAARVTPVWPDDAVL